MDGDGYNFFVAFRTKCLCNHSNESNQFPMDTLNVLLEFVMIHNQIFTIDLSSKNRHCLYDKQHLHLLTTLSVIIFIALFSGFIFFTICNNISLL